MIIHLEQLVGWWSSEYCFLESYRRTQFDFLETETPNLDIIMWLVSKGFDVINNLYYTSLNDKDSCALFKYLVSQGTGITDNDNYAVRLASSWGYLKTVKYLVSQGADITAKDNCAVGWASSGGHFKTVKYLVSQGADVSADDNYALRWASINGHLKTVKWVVSQSADITADNNCAVKWAAYNGHVETVKWLIENGADREVALKYGTPEIKNTL